jgi:serine/threonine protein phosphatase PrpC
VVRLIAQAYSFPKDPAAPRKWEDAAACSVRSGRFAVADGVSQAFRSREWAHVLAQAYVHDFPQSATVGGERVSPARQRVIKDWFGQQVHQWHEQAPEAKTRLDQRAELSRPPSATFAGLHFIRGGAGLEWEACVFGDCCLLQVSDGRLAQSFPLTAEDQFTTHPDLITTAHGRLEGSLATLQTRTGSASPGDIFVLASDALSACLLGVAADHPSVLGRIGFLGSGEFTGLITDLRKAGAIEIDDVAMVVVAVCQ